MAFASGCLLIKYVLHPLLKRPTSSRCRFLFVILLHLLLLLLLLIIINVFTVYFRLL